VKFILLLFLSLSFLFSCEKSEDRSCFKTSGETITTHRNLNDFNCVRLFKNINYEIVPDTINYLELTGGKNVLNFISSTISGKVLTIKDDNTCAFLRDLARKVTVKIHTKDLINIYYEGSESLICRDTLKMNYFLYVQQSGGGTANLLIEAKYLEAYVNSGVGDFKLAGKCNVLTVGLNGSSFCDVRGLEVTDSITFIQNSFGDMKIKADVIPLRGVITSTGNVWCQGLPSFTKVNELYTGKLKYLPSSN
jgi:hypothetical protein